MKKLRIKDSFPIKLKDEIEIKIDEQLKKKIDKIISIFGEKNGYELELKTLEMLGITPGGKEKYFGIDVETIIRKKSRINFIFF